MAKAYDLLYARKETLDENMKPEVIADSISNIDEDVINDYFETKSNPRERLKKRKNINRPLLCLIILVLPAVIFAMWAQFNVKGTFNKYAKIRTKSGMTGAMAARQILDRNGLSNVRIERVSGELSDHFNPKNNTVFLSWFLP